MFLKKTKQSAARKTTRDLWPAEREGYSDQRQVAYAAISSDSPKQRRGMTIGTEEHISTLLVISGIAWSAHVATKNFAGLMQLELLPPGPLEVCAVGILVWLHAKWRRLAKVS